MGNEYTYTLIWLRIRLIWIRLIRKDTSNKACYYFSINTKFQGKSIHSDVEILLPTNIVSAIFVWFLSKKISLRSSKLEQTDVSFKPVNISHKLKKISFKTNKKNSHKNQHSSKLYCDQNILNLNHSHISISRMVILLFFHRILRKLPFIEKNALISVICIQSKQTFHTFYWFSYIFYQLFYVGYVNYQWKCPH